MGVNLKYKRKKREKRKSGEKKNGGSTVLELYDETAIIPFIYSFIVISLSFPRYLFADT